MRYCIPPSHNDQMANSFSSFSSLSSISSLSGRMVEFREIGRPRAVAANPADTAVAAAFAVAAAMLSSFYHMIEHRKYRVSASSRV